MCGHSAWLSSSQTGSATGARTIVLGAPLPVQVHWIENQILKRPTCNIRVRHRAVRSGKMCSRWALSKPGAFPFAEVLYNASIRQKSRGVA
jgi:hypothetical protein